MSTVVDDVKTTEIDSSLRRGEIRSLSGIIHSIAFEPAKKNPTFEVVVAVGEQRIKVVFIGRSWIRGFFTSCPIRIVGRLMLCGKEFTMFNPMYELQRI